MRVGTDKASEIFRKNPKWAKKFLVIRKLTDMVMGDPNFLPNPCAILCPFDGPRCTHGFFRMNGSCKPSQLFSHWQHMHANNPAAKQLEARWRQAIKMKGTSRSSSSTSDVGKVLLTAELLEKEASIRDVCEAERRAGAAKMAAVEAVVARVEGEAAGGDRLALEALRGAEAAARRASGDAQAELDRLKRMHQLMAFRRATVAFGAAALLVFATATIQSPPDEDDEEEGDLFEEPFWAEFAGKIQSSVDGGTLLRARRWGNIANGVLLGTTGPIALIISAIGLRLPHAVLAGYLAALGGTITSLELGLSPIAPWILRFVSADELEGGDVRGGVDQAADYEPGAEPEIDLQPPL
ncbi:hypothetical protein EMIHUDRAFT_463555 [Emiliania huxleyi CCMP1516]|uniref:Zinc finger GRF-type domain-containing protein n=2 Tax=Emiliania huxleyi TaxID=2903 RepID=A0A0D3JMA5_EMIH1|nr:hypothetical protein EMIHUDRAFT_463555 [Emiliania huxleyi CCMP1516]EOD24640.1 hypothetical protein EMIHUDRAFT_463555 [Emiliania huxleyi CCMP1516]|eukprot:XP_005777069.1 hypothetical protein EMIHUDRAFT_463555 [Emiliania huxleyi CCMP1516]